MGIHLVYAGDYHYAYGNERLKSLILKGMKKYKIKKVMVTRIYMKRRQLITKEEMEKFCKGKEYDKISVNDDLETLFEDIQLESWGWFVTRNVCKANIALVHTE